MEREIQAFIEYYRARKNGKANTVDAYGRDLAHFAEYMRQHGRLLVTEVTDLDVSGYRIKLETEGYSAATISRKASSLKAFFGYLLREGIVSQDPTEDLHGKPIEAKPAEILSPEEVGRLFAAPDKSGAAGIRDVSMLMMLYYTGLRVTELLTLSCQDVNLSLRAVRCGGIGKERVIPIAKACAEELQEYLTDARPRLKPKTELLFVNNRGEAMTRQGFWKNIKRYGRVAGIEKELSPQLMRRTFATHMVGKGADLGSLQEILGHAHISTTTSYISSRRGRLKEVYDHAADELLS